MKLDAARSRLVIHTFAEGLFSALAHDLELVARDLSGEASETGAASAELRIAVHGLEVRGAVKRGKLDEGALSASDRDAIRRQIQDDVFRRGREVLARGELEGTRARIRVTAPTGEADVSCDVEILRNESRGVRGTVDVSLRALGVAPVKGPLGAFKLSDRVRVTFDLVFVAG